MSLHKEKYTLTDDIIEIKREPVQYSKKEYERKNTPKINNSKDRLSLNIDRDIKTNLHMYCIRNKKAMTDVIETLIEDFLKKQKTF